MTEAERCARCLLTDRVPGVTLDDARVCSICREYDEHRATYDGYFRSEHELIELLAAGRDPAARHDVLLMYSGGKDSTYVLYRLRELGQRVLALTFDNGYIPRGCFDNIAGVCSDAGVDSVIVGVDRERMNQVFAESLRNRKTVCSGCFRGLTARGAEVAIAERIPIVMTGLSRGQIFDTKVHPLMRRGIVDGAQIDRMLDGFREGYHALDDRIGRLIEDRALADPSAFHRLRFVDFFRYSAATKREVQALIAARAPFWRKPEHVGGCSSNCMINDAGIQVHLETRGFHSYAVHTSWEVRFGHLSRDEALEEISAPIDRERVGKILRVIGYTP